MSLLPILASIGFFPSVIFLLLTFRKSFFHWKRFACISTLLICGAVILFISQEKISFLFHFVVTGFFLIDMLMNLGKIPRLYARKDRYEKAAILLSLFTVSVLFATALVDFYLWLVVLYMLSILFLKIFTFFSAFPKEIYEDYLVFEISKIRKKNTMCKIIVIYSDSFRSNSFHRKEIHYIKVENLQKVKNVLLRTTNKHILVFHFTSHIKSINSVLIFLKPKMIIKDIQIDRFVLNRLGKRVKIIEIQKSVNKDYIRKLLDNFAK